MFHIVGAVKEECVEHLSFRKWVSSKSTQDIESKPRQAHIEPGSSPVLSGKSHVTCATAHFTLLVVVAVLNGQNLTITTPRSSSTPLLALLPFEAITAETF